jgi:hypothetical protein
MMMAVTLGMPTGYQLFYLETEELGISEGREVVAIEGLWNPEGMVDAAHRQTKGGMLEPVASKNNGGN